MYSRRVDGHTRTPGPQTRLLYTAERISPTPVFGCLLAMTPNFACQRDFRRRR
jgi:hypothetical protein